MLTRKQLNRTLRTLSLDSDGGSQLLEIAPRVQVISGHCADKWPAEAGIMSASYTFCASLQVEAAVPERDSSVRSTTGDQVKSFGLSTQPGTVTTRRDTEGGIAGGCERTGSAHPLAMRCAM